MSRPLWILGVAGWVVLLPLPAFGDIHAVAKPETQTVPINGTAAQFDGSDSYTDEEMPISDWAWDLVGDSGILCRGSCCTISLTDGSLPPVALLWSLFQGLA